MSTKRTTALALGVGLGAAAVGAVAGDLAVVVRHADRGSPLAGAQVCVGTPANPTQFGAGYSDTDGELTFSRLPTTQLVLTVTGAGFRGERQMLGSASFDRRVIVDLRSGGLGPDCGLPLALGPTAPSGALAVRGLRVLDLLGADDPPRVRLGYELDGAATEYRVSESADFADAPWLPLAPAPEYRLRPGAGAKTVYFQVRRHSELEGGELTIESDVASVRLRLNSP